MVRIILCIVFLFCINVANAQQHIVRSIISQGDTLPHLWLHEAIVKGKTHNKAWLRRYYRKKTRLEYNVRKVYPYARIAAAKVKEIEKRIARLEHRTDKKEIIKQEYSELMKTFKAPLMKLSITQGRILIRLIYRETNHTSFAHIREYRGAVNAYFWQSIALLFGNNLKAAYDPFGEDAEIEEIVQKIIKEKNGTLP